jgi:peptidoglycan hydrolase CwlO-like protein
MSTIAPSVMAAIAAIIAALLAFRASTRANATNDRKVNLDEYKEQQERYRRIIEDQDRQIERTRSLAERNADQLTREQEVTAALRAEVRALQGQIDLLTRSGGRRPPTSETSP